MDDDDPLLDNHHVIEQLTENENPKSIDALQEWFIWSYLNVLISGAIPGVLAVGCSLRTNKFKRRNNYSKAQKWSRITFLLNFLITSISLAFLGYFIFRQFRPR